MKQKKVTDNFRGISQEDELIASILEASAEKAKKQIREKGVITLNDAIPLLLLGQYNHIKHLDERITNMATKDDIANIKDDIKQLRWLFGIGFGVLGVLIALLKLFG